MIEISKDEALAAVRAAAWTEHVEPVYEQARVGRVPLWLHACGHVEAFTDRSEVAGGCDACESGSPDPTDWQALYVDVTPTPQRRIHTFRGSFGADWDLDVAEDVIRTAQVVGWSSPHILGHELVVGEPDGGVVRFDVTMPATTEETREQS